MAAIGRGQEMRGRGECNSKPPVANFPSFLLKICKVKSFSKGLQLYSQKQIGPRSSKASATEGAFLWENTGQGTISDP